MQAMIRYPALLLLLLALALPARASASSDEDLLALDARWNTLRLQPDAPALEALLADDWMLTHSDGRVQHKAGLPRRTAHPQPQQPAHPQRGRPPAPLRRHRGGHRDQHPVRTRQRPAVERPLPFHPGVGAARWRLAHGRLAFLAHRGRALSFTAAAAAPPAARRS
jgi:hypothetical protein